MAYGESTPTREDMIRNRIEQYKEDNARIEIHNEMAKNICEKESKSIEDAIESTKSKLACLEKDIKKFIDIDKEISIGYNKYKQAKDNIEEYTDKLEVNSERKSVVEKARAFFQVHAENTQREIADTLSVIITSALKSVFPDDYECIIEFGTKRNHTLIVS